jgi:hypothetical protein
MNVYNVRMMKTIAALALTLCAIAAQVASAHAFDDAAFCKALKDYAEKTKADAGTMLEQTTRFDGMVVLCGARVVNLYHFVTVPASRLRDGWQGRKQKQWNEIYCLDPPWRAAIAAGWTVKDTVTFVDGTRVSLTAEC